MQCIAIATCSNSFISLFQSRLLAKGRSEPSIEILGILCAVPNGAMKREYATVFSSSAVDGIGNVTVTGTREVVHQCAATDFCQKMSTMFSIVFFCKLLLEFDVL